MLTADWSWTGNGLYFINVMLQKGERNLKTDSSSELNYLCVFLGSKKGGSNLVDRLCTETVEAVELVSCNSSLGREKSGSEAASFISFIMLNSSGCKTSVRSI